MGALATITSKGQVTLPKSVREKHGLKPGDVIEFKEENGLLVVRTRSLRAIDVFGVLGPPPSGASLEVLEDEAAVMKAVAEDDLRIGREWKDRAE